MNHFGLKIMEGKYGFYLTRDNYAPIISHKVRDKDISLEKKISEFAFNNVERTEYTSEWVQYYRELALVNLEINLDYFESLNEDDFNREVDVFLVNNPKFKNVTDLNIYEKKSGYYILIFDNYKQLYIGTSKDIKARIRQHWTNPVILERSMMPMYAYHKSKIACDSFRALDNTRIFAALDNDIFLNEQYYIAQMPNTYLLNRIEGGIVNTKPFVEVIQDEGLKPSVTYEIPLPPSTHEDMELHRSIVEGASEILELRALHRAHVMADAVRRHEELVGNTVENKPVTQEKSSPMSRVLLFIATISVLVFILIKIM